MIYWDWILLFVEVKGASLPTIKFLVSIWCNAALNKNTLTVTGQISVFYSDNNAFIFARAPKEVLMH
jgi:hypothetical protein